MKRFAIITLAVLMGTALTGEGEAMAKEERALERITLGGGCFWCIEAVFEELEGVVKAESGYAGGDGPAEYKAVCSGATGHAEVVRVTYDPAVVSVRDILGVFFAVHDPTTPNRQGADVGTQYRSVIFHETKAQAVAAQEAVAKLEADKVWPDRVVTQIEPLEEFFPAEPYHQDYYRNNKSQGYCQVVINPKLAKFRKEFAERLKD